MTNDKRMIIENTKFYGPLLDAHPELGAAVTGQSEQSQGVRLSVVRDFVLEQAAGLDQFSVLDVGCGLGHLRTWLAGLPVSYRGIDLMADRYREAILNVDSQADTSWLHQANLHDLDRSEWQADFTVAVGTFAHDWEGRDQELPLLMEKMWQLTRRGLIVLFVSELAPPKIREVAEVPMNDPGYWMKWASEHAPRFNIRHDYLPHDFALMMMRRPFGE